MKTAKMAAPPSTGGLLDETVMASVVLKVGPHSARSSYCPAVSVGGEMSAENSPFALAVVAPTLVPSIVRITGELASQPAPVTLTDSPGIRVLLEPRLSLAPWELGGLPDPSGETVGTGVTGGGG